MANLKEIIENFSSAEYKNIPDLGLYMDQVIAYMQGQHIGFSGGETLTPAMINNYVKSGLMPRADGKKYSREHIAYLTVICTLKQILSVADVAILLQREVPKTGIENFYNKFSLSSKTAFAGILKNFSKNAEEKGDGVLSLAAESYAKKFACEVYIKEMKSPAEEQKSRKAAKTEEKEKKSAAKKK